jgi:hypothetical protein
MFSFSVKDELYLHYMKNIQAENLIIDKMLIYFEKELGKDFQAYKGHVYRVFNCSLILSGRNLSEDETDKYAVAAVFHDIGIWTDKTFDYIRPSVEKVEWYLSGINRLEWKDELVLMIEMHHKITPYKGPFKKNVEIFRRADLADLSLGLIRFDLDLKYIEELKRTFANSGFHRRLLGLSLRHILHNPFRPFPMYRF